MRSRDYSVMSWAVTARIVPRSQARHSSPQFHARTSVIRRILAAAAVYGFVLSSTASGQITTSAIGGRVTAEGGAPLPQADVVATHIPTGARFAGKTADDGRYLIANVRAGGPYTIAVRRIG